MEAEKELKGSWGAKAQVRGRLWATAGRRAAHRIQERLEARLHSADVHVNGDRPWDPQVHDLCVFNRFLRRGSLGVGEAYVRGIWDCDALDEMTARIARAGIDQALGKNFCLGRRALASWFINRQSVTAAAANGQAHYDLGDDLYEAMLGRSMAYSCAYWRSAETLDAAQRAKLELICAKLKLEAGQRILDIGCGWGELARHAAAYHGAQVVGITVSHNQAAHARTRCAGLPVEIRIQDYREIEGRFDRIVSVGMFEHVGPRNYRRFFSQVRSLLKPSGLFLLHTIGNSASKASFDPWLDRHVFPGAVLPSPADITAGLEGRFILEDWHNFGADYGRTLVAWHKNFEQAWPRLSHYGEAFRRTWRYYLLTCAGLFRARRNQLWQLVLSPSGHCGGYLRPLI